MYSTQNSEEVAVLPAEAAAPDSKDNENNPLTYNSALSLVSVGVGEGPLDSEMADEDESLHIGELIDPNDLRMLRGGEPLHIGEFVDPDAPIYEVDDEALHIGEDLSAYDPMEFSIEEDTRSLRLGEDLSAYDPSEISVLTGDEPELHEGELIHDP